VRGLQRTIDLSVVSVDNTSATEGDQLYLFLFAGFKADSRTGGYIESFPISLMAIKGKGSIHFEKVVMASDLDRTISRIFDQDRNGRTSGIDSNPAIFFVQKIFAWLHDGLLSHIDAMDAYRTI
jgi:hypothetical protein